MKKTFRISKLRSKSGADPEFPVEGAPALKEGAPTYDIAKIFQKNCMKLRKFWAVGGGGEGGAPRAPLDPSLQILT